ncbi:hypothetical protein [Thiolapillus sp.]|uniref:hypothetical protein n=2 Tax=Thiolapillus sp. TaxID=2017437 RepID=UPI003AF6A86E
MPTVSISSQACLRPRDRFWDIPVPKIDSAFDNLFVPQPSWSPSTTQQLRRLVAAPHLAPNDWTPRLDAYFASPLALCARRVSSAASRLLRTASPHFALHGWQRRMQIPRRTPAWQLSGCTWCKEIPCFQRLLFQWRHCLAGRHCALNGLAF